MKAARLVLVVTLAAGLLAGCSRTRSTAPTAKAVVPPDPDLPNPDPSRMSFDAASSVLTLHALPPRGEWTVRDINDTRYAVVDLACQLPPGVDPSKIEIFYVLPGLRPSNAIFLRNVVAAHTPPPEP